MAMTIKVLQIRLEVEGDDFEREWLALFNRHMPEYERQRSEVLSLSRLADFERHTGDQTPGAME